MTRSLLFVAVGLIACSVGGGQADGRGFGGFRGGSFGGFHSSSFGGFHSDNFGRGGFDSFGGSHSSSFGGTRSESRGGWDLMKVVATIPAEEAFRSVAEGGCPLVR